MTRRGNALIGNRWFRTSEKPLSRLGARVFHIGYGYSDRSNSGLRSIEAQICTMHMLPQKPTNSSICDIKADRALHGTAAFQDQS